MASFTAGEREDVAAMIRAEYMQVAKRIETEHLVLMRQVNAALDKIQDAAQLVLKVELELNRIVNLVEGFDIRLQEVEAEFGW